MSFYVEVRHLSFLSQEELVARFSFSPSVASGKETPKGSSTCHQTKILSCSPMYLKNKMTHPEESFPLQQSSPMARQSMAACCKASGITDGFIFIGGAVVALLLVWSCWSFVSPAPVPSNFPSIFSTDLNDRALKDDKNEPLLKCTRSEDETHRGELETPTFYDDPALTYMVEQKLTNWDAKRQQWLRDHPSLTRGAGERVLLVTGSQPRPCHNPVGDHFLLRFFKNKVDYCRINGCDLYYNNALLHPKMTTFWAKIPLIRAAMVAHPDAEWVWWVDSDAAFTDMEFRLPLDRYRAHNFVVHAWAHLVYEKKSWVSLNAGVFLIRNCQWSLDFMERWATMGPQTPDYDKWGKIQRATTKDKVAPESDDQSGLVYLLLKEKEQWADKIYLESEYYFEGYWLDIVGKLQNITDRYVAMERGVERLRRRHAEKVNGEYAEIREPYLRGAGYGKDGWRRPFITHFTGCQPCSGVHNEMYSGESCSEGMQRALNFADNQVLRNYGFSRLGLLDSDHVEPLPYGYPAA